VLSFLKPNAPKYFPWMIGWEGELKYAALDNFQQSGKKLEK